MEKKEREELIERLDIMDGFPEWKVPCHSCQKGGMIEDMNGNVYTCGECGGSEWIVNPELVKVFEQELDKAREEGYDKGVGDGMKGKMFKKVEIKEEVHVPKEFLDKAREEGIKDLIKKIEEAHCDSISLELLKEIDLSKLKQ